MGYSKYDALNQARHHQYLLGFSMPKEGMRHVHNRRAVRGSRVYHLENRLEISVEVDDRAGIPGKLKNLVSLIPPAMC